LATCSAFSAAYKKKSSNQSSQQSNNKTFYFLASCLAFSSAAYKNQAINQKIKSYIFWPPARSSAAYKNKKKSIQQSIMPSNQTIKSSHFGLVFSLLLSCLHKSNNRSSHLLKNKTLYFLPLPQPSPKQPSK
jgi:hypothetical protein